MSMISPIQPMTFGRYRVFQGDSDVGSAGV
jgi:hypothetical protein